MEQILANWEIKYNSRVFIKILRNNFGLKKQKNLMQ